ncbi:MAG: Hint domain-containing protein [Pseudomonadota bacterium]
MTQSHSPVDPQSTALTTSSSNPPAGRAQGQDGKPRPKPLMRKYEVTYLTDDNQIEEFSRIAPAAPPFEDCFAAIGRGAILQTEMGPVAVEDLLPGDKVKTESGGLQTLKWRGTMTIVPGAQNRRPEMGTMTRLTSDAMGLGRPALDLVLGPAARVLHKAPGMKTLTGSDIAFIPARDFIDGSSIIELKPIAPVHCYQLGFDHHERILVNGIEIETLHPGLPHMIQMRQDIQMLFMSLFPHKQRLSDFNGLLHPRINLRDLDLFAVA